MKKGQDGLKSSSKKAISSDLVKIDGQEYEKADLNFINSVIESLDQEQDYAKNIQQAIDLLEYINDELEQAEDHGNVLLVGIELDPFQHGLDEGLVKTSLVDIQSELKKIFKKSDLLDSYSSGFASRLDEFLSLSLSSNSSKSSPLKSLGKGLLK